METQILNMMNMGAFGFMMAFARIGTAVMIMPGLGNSFTPARIRLHIALALTFAFFPLIAQSLPEQIPQSVITITIMLFSEIVIGLLFGTMARIFMSALDTAGMIISIQSGLGSAQIFNPSLASQGSVIGAMLSVMGVIFIFASNLHHVLILGVIESYSMFPIGGIPDTGDMSKIILNAVGASFALGLSLTAPFIIVTLLMYIGIGVLTRLMPQMQAFMIVLPLQILISMAVLMVSIGAIINVWGAHFVDALLSFP